MRAAFGLKTFSNIAVKDRMLNSPHDNVVSIPLYCALAGISVSEVEFEQAVIQMKPEYNNPQFFKEEIEVAFDRMQEDHKSMAPRESIMND
jgi:hypothetical protein